MRNLNVARTMADSMLDHTGGPVPTMPSTSGFDVVLSDVLRTAGITRAELARRLNKNKSTVTRWTNGEDRPEPDAVVQIADAVNVDRRWLLVRAGYLRSEGDSDTPVVPPLDPELAPLFQQIQDRVRKMAEPDRQRALDIIALVFSLSEERVRGAGSARVRTPRQLAARMPTTSSDGTGQSHNVPIERSNRAIHDLLSHLVTLRGVTPWAAAAV